MKANIRNTEKARAIAEAVEDARLQTFADETAGSPPAFPKPPCPEIFSLGPPGGPIATHHRSMLRPRSACSKPSAGTFRKGYRTALGGRKIAPGKA